MELWIARDKDTNELWAYDNKPIIVGELFKPDFSKENWSGIEFPEDWFPEVTFDNSPQKIELKLIK